MMTFGEMIFWHASRNPDKAALVGPGRIVTYGGLREAIGACASRIQGLGWTPGGTVGILVEDRVGHIVVTAALGWLGFATMPAGSWEEILKAGVPLAGVISGRPAPAGNTIPSVQIDASWIAAGPDQRTPARVERDPSAIHHVALTSGSTGIPKPVGFDANAIREIQIETSLIGNSIVWDRICCLPNFQSWFGYLVGTMTFFLGRTLVYGESVRDCLNLASIFGVEWMTGSNIQVERLIHFQATTPITCPNLRLVSFAGSLVTTSLLRAARTYLSAQIVCSYGSTEGGFISSGPAERMPARDGATGFLAPWATVQIVDGEGNEVPPGSEGLIRSRTPSQGRIFNASTKAFEEIDPVSGWVYSGDLGTVLPDGVLVITGRANEIINAGGVKISPEIFEQTLRAQPGVAEAAVVSLPDPFGVEEVWVAVVPGSPNADREALRRECLQRIRQVGVRQLVFVDAIPKTELGKVARAEMRKILRSMGAPGGT